MNERAPKGKLASFLGLSLTRNMIALYSAHAARYLMPLVTLPYLTRVLGADKWGTLAFVQAYGVYLAVLLEFGFGLSATREVSQRRESEKECAEILAGVSTAKILLALLAVVITSIAWIFVPIMRENGKLLWVGTFAAIAQGMNLIWFFQGLEKMRLVAALDIFAKLFATAGIFLFVHSPSDAWKVLACYFVANSISFIIALWVAYSKFPVLFPPSSMIWLTIRKSWMMFLARVNGVFFSAGNTLILGFAASPEIVGYFAAAERIATAIRGLLTPAVQAVYPRISKLVTQSIDRAGELLQKELYLLGAISLFLGCMLFGFSSIIVSEYLGKHFGPSAVVLKIFAFLPPVVAINLILGTHWLLPLGYERVYLEIGIQSVLLNVALTILSVIFVPAWAHIGAACAVIFSLIFQNVRFIVIAKKKTAVLGTSLR